MASIIQLTGAVAITTGAFLFSPVAGLVVAGAFLILIGLAVTK
jgi:hypothetical protein